MGVSVSCFDLLDATPILLFHEGFLRFFVSGRGVAFVAIRLLPCRRMRFLPSFYFCRNIGFSLFCSTFAQVKTASLNGGASIDVLASQL